MKVLVVGAGVGGLVLAHGLRRHGIEVRVYDRDTEPADTGGYRLHLDGTACAALAATLPAPTYQALLASSSGGHTFRQFAVLDHRLRPLLRLPLDRGEEQVLIGRVPLRTVLCHGLGGTVRFGHEFTHHTREPDGTVTAHFANGHTDTGDLLVGADGARSTVATALAGEPTVRELRAGGLAGRTRITGHTRHLLPEAVAHGPAFVAGPGGVAIFLSAHHPDSAVVDPAECAGVPAVTEEPYVLWGITVPGGSWHMTAEPERHAREIVASYSPRMRALLAAAEPGSVTAFPYLAADPARELIRWPAGPVTALGDAVHAMPPTGGRGAITAIVDAERLAGQLARVRCGELTVPLAVHEFQRALPGYALPALRESLQPLTQQRYLANPVLFHALRYLLPAVDTTRRALTRS